jgi:hypothetical protein
MPSVQPLQGYLARDDPDLEAKAADIIGLYLHAPQHAAGRRRFRPWTGSIPCCPFRR